MLLIETIKSYIKYIYNNFIKFNFIINETLSKIIISGPELWQNFFTTSPRW